MCFPSHPSLQQPLDIVNGSRVVRARAGRTVSARVLGLAFCGLVLHAQPLPTQSDVRPVRPMPRKLFNGPPGDEFYNVTAATVDRSGTAIWFVQGGGDVPLRIDRRSDRIDRISTLGDGPGEFRRITNVLPGRNTEIIIYDQQLHRVTHLDLSGKRLSDWTVLRGRTIGWGRLLSDARGIVYLVQEQQTADGRFAGTAPVRISPNGGFDTLALPARDSIDRSMWYARLPDGSWTNTRLGSARFLWTIDALGRIVYAWTDSNWVAIRKQTGDVRVTFARLRDRLPPAQVRYAEERIVREFEARVKAAGGQPEHPRPDVARFHDQIGGLIATLDGGVAVLRGRECANLPEWRDPETGARARAGQWSCRFVERISPDGRRLQPFTLPEGGGGNLVQIRGDTVWMTLKIGGASPQSEFVRFGEFIVPSR